MNRGRFGQLCADGAVFFISLPSLHGEGRGDGEERFAYLIWDNRQHLI
jgi:hypothetical protein